MMKLGKNWKVLQYINKKKRPAAEVARDLDERMRKKAREILGSVAKPVMDNAPPLLSLLASNK